jgi:hypothetical protein
MLTDLTNLLKESEDTVQSGKILFTISRTKKSHDSETEMIEWEVMKQRLATMGQWFLCIGLYRVPD